MRIGGIKADEFGPVRAGRVYACPRLPPQFGSVSVPSGGAISPRDTEVLSRCKTAVLGLARAVVVRFIGGEHAEYVLPPLADRECPVMIAETNAGIPV